MLKTGLAKQGAIGRTVVGLDVERILIHGVADGQPEEEMAKRRWPMAATQGQGRAHAQIEQEVGPCLDVGKDEDMLFRKSPERLPLVADLVAAN